MVTLKTIRGQQGVLTFTDGTTTSCDFVIRQTVGNGLRVTVSLPPPQVLRLAFDDTRKPVRLVGNVDGGRPLTLAGDFLCVRTRGGQATFVCTGPAPLRLGAETEGKGRLVVLLTNCFFDGTEPIVAPDATWYRGALPLNIGGRSVRLEQRYSAYEAKRTLREAGRTAITARVITGSDIRSRSASSRAVSGAAHRAA
jgi:hypothetical protein